MGGFKEFLFRGNLIQLAVAVVIGAAFGALVTAFTSGLITPLLGIFGGTPSFATLQFRINGSEFKYGRVIDALITFVITAFVLYYAVVYPSSFLMDKFKKKEESNKRSCIKCCSQIDKKAIKCPFCTSNLEPEPEPEKLIEDEMDEDNLKKSGPAPAEV